MPNYLHDGHHKQMGRSFSRNLIKFLYYDLFLLTNYST